MPIAEKNTKTKMNDSNVSSPKIQQQQQRTKSACKKQLSPPTVFLEEQKERNKNLQEDEIEIWSAVTNVCMSCVKSM